MTGQCYFQATTHGGTIDSGHNRFTHGFIATKLTFLALHHGKKIRDVFFFYCKQRFEIATGKKGLLGGSEDNTRNVINLSIQTVECLLHVLFIISIHGIHRLARHIHGNRDNIVSIFFVNETSHFEYPFRFVCFRLFRKLLRYPCHHLHIRYTGHTSIDVVPTHQQRCWQSRRRLRPGDGPWQLHHR